MMQTWIKNHPIISYIVLVMIWSWSIWSLLFLVIKPGGLLHNPPPISFLFVILGGIGPSLSGLILTKIIYGKEGIRLLFCRLKNWKVGIWWWAILIIPLTTLLTPTIRHFLGYSLDFKAMQSLLLPGISIGIIAGLMEEIGWRGFLLPHLLKKYSPLKATLILGLIWGGLWHGYADYFGLGGYGIYFWPLMILLGPGVLTAWSLLLTWAYKNTNGSLLISIAIHASISSSAFIFGQKYISVTEEIWWTTISVAIAFLISGFIFLLGNTNNKLSYSQSG